MKKATFKDQDIIADILHKAFSTETFPNSINFVVKQDGKKSKRLYHLMKYQCKMALYFGDIFISDDAQCCILFLDSERRKMTFRSLLLDIKLVIFCIGISNVPKVIRRERLLKANHPKVPFLHLWIMGTKPQSKGKGIGATLLKKVLHYYDHSKPVYLETTTESNRRFYKNIGFEIFNESKVLEYPLYFLLKSANKQGNTMNLDTKIKLALYNQCQHYIDQRIQRIQNTISDILESLNSETKSTAGDKHETGRAMLQLEREKAGTQLAEAQKLQETLAKTDITTTSKVIRLGSMVETSMANYFLSISAGKIVVEDTTYFAIATNTPIGKLLLGKKSGDSYSFNGNKMIIKKIV